MQKKKILVIDDDPGFSQMITDYFTSQKYEIFSANNLEEAVSIFNQQRPAVVLLDYSMPVLNGEKVLPLLQSLDPSIQVIVVSGFTEQEVEEKFKGLGYFASFRKGGLSLEALKNRVDKAFEAAP